MSTNTLGRSAHFDEYWANKESYLADEIEIVSYELGPVPEIEEIDDYPFSRQTRIQGRFKYRIPSYSDSEPYEPKGTFEYRCGSELFIISTDASKPNHERVISKINERLSRDAEIKEALSISRRQLWNLFEDAESVRPFRIIGREGEYDLNDLLKILHASDGNPQRTLKEFHQESEVDNFSSLSRVIQNIHSVENVQSVMDLDIDLYKCRVTYAEAEFRCGHEFVTITYNRGMITIDAPSDSSREYAIQLIERDLLSSPATE